METETLKEQAQRIKQETAYEEVNCCENCGIPIKKGQRWCWKCDREIEERELEVEAEANLDYGNIKRPFIRFLAWICAKPPKTFWETKIEELERNKEIADRLYNMILENQKRQLPPRFFVGRDKRKSK